jgi:hypothetical protein
MAAPTSSNAASSSTAASANATGGAAGAPSGPAPQQQQQPAAPPPPPSSPGPQGAAAAAARAPEASAGAFLRPVYVFVFSILFLGGLLFASMSLQLTADVGFFEALGRITRRVLRSIAFRQLVVISVAIFLVRFALNNVLRVLAAWSSSPVPWDKSKVYYVMKEVGAGTWPALFSNSMCSSMIDVSEV